MIRAAKAAVDKHGRTIRIGDRVAFYKSRWLFWSTRHEGTVQGIAGFYGIVLIAEDGQAKGTLCWGRHHSEVERLG